MLNTPTYDYKYGDMKFYYGIHVNRQKSLGNDPVKYDQFIKRAKVMNLHDAIYTPRAKEVKARESKTPIQDDIRRKAKLKEQNVQVLDLDELMKVEAKYEPKPKPETQTKPTLLTRFISLFK